MNQTHIQIVHNHTTGGRIVQVKSRGWRGSFPADLLNEREGVLDTLIADAEALADSESVRAYAQIAEQTEQIAEAKQTVQVKTAEVEAKTAEVAHKQRILTTVLPAVEASAPDEVLLAVAEIFPEWADFVDTEIPQGKVIRHAGNLYRARSQHLALEHYPPGIDTASLYLMIVPPEEEGVTLPWENRHDMQKELYNIGDIVTHNGYYWTSKIDNNTYEPSDAAYAAWEKGDQLVQ